jgi:pimeloyl-ACP methyl ester carboxylesterase
VVKEKSIPSFDGLSIDYAVSGSADLRFIFLHGWSCNRSFFQAQIDYFSASFTCLVPDLPARGHSFESRQAWDISSYAKDVAELIDAEVPGQTILIGHSMGGAVALEAAALRPDKVTAVVMADTHVFDYGSLDEATISGFLDSMRTDLDGFIRGLVTSTSSTQASQELIEWIIEQMTGCSLDIALPTLESLLRWKALPLLQHLKMPVIAMHSELINEQARLRYADFMKFYPLSGAGHFLQLENADGFNDLLQQVLKDSDVLQN